MGKILTRNNKLVKPKGYIYKQYLRGVCPRCKDMIVRATEWEFDLALRWHDFFYHGVPMSVAMPISIKEGE